MRKSGIISCALLIVTSILVRPLHAQKIADNGANSGEDVILRQCKILLDKGDFARADSLFGTLNPAFTDTLYTNIQKRLSLINSLKKQEPNGKLVPCPGINTEYDEFAARLSKGNLLFTSNRPNRKSRRYRSSPTAKIFEARAWETPADKKINLYRPKIQDAWHNSNLCYIGDTLLFDRSSRRAFKKDLDGVSQLKLIMAVTGKKPRKLIPAPVNVAGYNCAHPWYDSLRNRLYFSSNRPGGYGAMDIWYCPVKGGYWGKPVNAGNGVNSAGNEIFPTVFGDRLYYSSDRPTGVGGLDVYAAAIPPHASSSHNLGAPVNSSYDDLSPVFLNIDTALMASDRPGGTGGDDIYRWVRNYPNHFFKTLQGKLWANDKPLINTRLTVRRANGTLIARTSTNEVGEFSLSNIRGAKNYAITFADADKLDSSLTYLMELFNAKGKSVQRVTINSEGEFLFKLLAPDDFDNLETLPNKDKSLLEIDLKGEVFSKKPGDLDTHGANGKVYLLSVRKDTLASVKLTDKGRFSLENLPPKASYILRTNVEEEHLVLRLINNKGEVLNTLVQINDTDFLYERLSPEDKYIVLTNENNQPIKVKLGEYFDIPNIYYKLNRWDIIPESARQLNKLVKLLENNPHAGIFLEAHTDSRGSKSYNLDLSEKRVNSTLKYLIERGIDSRRLRGVGKGESEPVNKCQDGVHCTAEEYAQNRRTEFSVFKLQ